MPGAAKAAAPSPAVPLRTGGGGNKAAAVTHGGGVAEVARDAEAYVEGPAAAAGAPSPPSSADLLVRLFESEFFNEWIALEYLYKSHSAGVHDFICNKLYSLPIPAIEKYLSQLCNLYVAYRPHLASLERAIVDLCGASIRLSVKAYWFLAALADDHPRSDAARAIRQRCEAASVSGTWRPPVPLRERLAGLELPPRRRQHAMSDVGSPTSPASPANSSLLSGPSDLSEQLDGVLGSPRARQSIFGATLDLVYALCEASAGLAAMPYDERQGALQRAVDGISDVLQTSMPDVIWPMGHEEVPRQVLSIVAEESVLLNSREKAPFMVFVEVLGEEDDEDDEDDAGAGDEPNCDRSQRSDSAGSSVSVPRLIGAPLLPARPGGSGGSGLMLPLLAIPQPPEPGKEAEGDEDDRPKTSPHTPLSPRSERSVSQRIDAAMAGLKPTGPGRGDGDAGGVVGVRELRGSRDDHVSVYINRAPRGSHVDVMLEVVAGGAAASAVPRRLSRQHHRMASREAFELVAGELGAQGGKTPAPVQRRLADPENDDIVRLSASNSPTRRAPVMIEGDGADGDADTPAMQVVFGERARDRKARIRAASPYGKLPGWGLRGLIVKSGDDVRQELLAMQLMRRFAEIFAESGLELWVHPFEVLVTGCSTGFIEVVPDALSLHHVKTRYKRDVLGEDVTSSNPASVVARLRRRGGGSGSTPNLDATASPSPSPSPSAPSGEGTGADAALGPHAGGGAQPGSPSRSCNLGELPEAADGNGDTPAGASAPAPATAPSTANLRDIFLALYGPAEGTRFRRAQRNFVESLAGYSIICYILNIRDRHNGNVMLDRQGHLVHIDFGFMLSNSPGGVNFESAPFKLTREYIELMGSDVDCTPSELLEYFKVLMIQGFLAARRHADEFVTLVEMMAASTAYPCFKAGATRVVSAMRKRFHLGIPEDEVVGVVLGLIEQSVDAWRTRHYDAYQFYVNGVQP